MRFYFCETCGKRVTDTDVESGIARDKKLKGVYCSDCATGVVTMETLPLTDQDARRILKKPPTPAEAAPRSGQASASEAKASERQGAGGSASREIPRPAKASTMRWIVALLAVAGTLVWLAYFSQSQPGPKVQPAKAQSQTPGPGKTVAESVPAALAQPPVAPSPPETKTRVAAEAPNVQRTGTETFEQEAEAAYAAMARFEGLDPGDVAGRVQRIETFLKTYDRAIVAARARVQLAQLRGPGASPATAQPNSPAKTQDPAAPAAGQASVYAADLPFRGIRDPQLVKVKIAHELEGKKHEHCIEMTVGRGGLSISCAIPPAASRFRVKALLLEPDPPSFRVMLNLNTGAETLFRDVLKAGLVQRDIDVKVAGKKWLFIGGGSVDGNSPARILWVDPRFYTDAGTEAENK